MTNRTLKRILQNKASLAGLVLVLFFAAVALFAPLLAPAQNPRDPYQLPQSSYEVTPQPPSAQHIFGTTEQQYD